MLHQNINFPSIQLIPSIQNFLFSGLLFFLFCNRKNNLSPNMYYILQCVFSLWIREKYAALVFLDHVRHHSGMNLSSILSAYVTLGRFMAAGYFSFYMKHYVNILRWCGIRTSCGIFKALWDQNHKETQMLSDTDILKIIYSHVLACFCIKTAHKMFSSMPSRNSFKDDRENNC